MSSFEYAVSYVIKNEKGFVNRPEDAGGPTNFGITQALLAKFRNASVSASDVENMTLDEAKAIYRKFFWDFLGLDDLTNGGVATAIMDVAVNSGPNEAIKLSQASANALGSKLTVDGIFGTGSKAAVNHADAVSFLAQFVPLVQNNYIDIVVAKPEKIVFLKGWLSRSQRLLTLMI